MAAAGWWALRRGAPPPAAPASAAPAATRPAATPTAAARYDVRAEFNRVLQAQTAGWGLDLKLEQSTLRMDHDKLVFNLRALQDGFVYAFYFGADGGLQQLFPNGLSPPPRVTKGQLLKLPQGRLDLNVAGPPGPSWLMVMVSRWPRDHAAALPREENGFRSFPVGPQAAELAARWKGNLPLIAGQAVCAGTAPCSDEFGAALVGFEVLP